MGRNTQNFIFFCEFVGQNLFNSPKSGIERSLCEKQAKHTSWKQIVIINKQWIVNSAKNKPY